MQAWDEFLLRQEKELGKETAQKWLRPLKMLRFDACNLYLEAPDAFTASWFEEHIRGRAQRGLFNNNNKPIKIHLALAKTSPQEQAHTKTSKKKQTVKTTSSFSFRFDELNQEASFENYVIPEQNRLAYKLLVESCRSAPTVPLDFNPIYLCGRSGTGKTHLMMAAALALQKQGKKVLYVRAETFTEHVVDAIRIGEMQAFRKSYRGVDALLIDDIEIFSRKNATQEEFFHTFNTLHVEGKQIIIASSLPPSELKFIEPRLVSRFEWGIVTPLQLPTSEEMKKIFAHRLIQLNFPLQESVGAFLLEFFGSSPKTLLKAIDALVLRTHLNRGISQALNVKGVQNTLKDLIAEVARAVLTPGKIIQAVAEYYGIRIDDILSKSQARECALPRQIAMHLCREQLKLPFMKIGEIFTRDHSTVMASVKQVQKGLESKNLEIAGPFNSILKLLNR